MALTKQALPINFSSGLDTKTDPRQVSPGRFLTLQNTVFSEIGLLSKRNGYKSLASLASDDFNYLTTFNGNLTAIGTTLAAYNAGSERWSYKGSINPVSLNVLPLIRSNTNQTYADTAIASNDLICTVFTDNIPNNGVVDPVYKYAVADSITGQNIIAPTAIPASGTVTNAPKVFLLGRFFVIVFQTNITSTPHLQYIAISIADPSIVTTATDISTLYSPSTTGSFDGVVVNNSLYLGWNGSDGGGAVRVTYIDSTLTQHNTEDYPGETGTIFSLTADTSGSTPIIYVSYYDSGTQDGFTLAVNQQLDPILAPTQIINGIDVDNLTTQADNAVLTAIYEVDNNYTYDASIATHYIQSVTCTQAGVVGSPGVVVRSLGLASEAFLYNDEIYFLGIYQSDYQPSYFLCNIDGDVVAKLAYSNGGSYLTTGLPSVNMNGTEFSIPYQIKDLVQSVNKSQGLANSAGIYAQTGINLATFRFAERLSSTGEIGNNLNLSGGFLWAYDGYLPVEQGFHLWPDYIEAAEVADPTPTGDTTSGDNVIENISDFTGLVVGMGISGTGIPTDTIVTAINTADNEITISQDATASNTTVTLTFTGGLIAQQYFYQVTYEWSDNQGNLFRSAPSVPVSITTTSGNSSVSLDIPTLRLTYKIANPVKIVIYRWSTAQQSYYQITSIFDPLLNDTSIDSITYQDISSDADILGNSLIYTTGGVLENIAAPATDIVTLFDSRLFVLNSEDRNTFFFSKQIIPGTPVEMSDLLSVFFSPSIGAQGDTGEVTAASAMDDKFIAFKNNAIYYMTGRGPDNTGANNQYSEPIFITSTIGCANQQSIVFIPQGLMFQSDKGIWLLGRDLSTSYIGQAVEIFNDFRVLSAINVPGTTQVRFTLENGLILMYDYFYAQWGSFTNVPAVSSTLYQGLHTYLNSSAQVMQENPGSYLDGSKPVLISFTTGWMNLMGLQGFERAYFFQLLGTYISPHKISIGIAYDYNESPSQNVLITPDNFNGVYGSISLYGGESPYGGNPNVEQWQVFFNQQKIQAFRLTINEIYDPSYGVVAGAGFQLSGINMIVGAKKGYTTLRASRSTG